jgi:hypothetical protein
VAKQRIGQITWGGLTFGPGSPYHVTSISGLDDLPDVRGEDEERTGQHGDYSGPDYAAARTIQLGLSLVADSPDHLRELTLALRAATQPQEDPAPLVLNDWDTLVYSKIRRRILPYDAEHLWRTGTAALEFYCPDPYLYGIEEHVATTTAFSPSAGRTYPLVYAGAGPAARNLVLNPSFEEAFTTETTGFGTNSTRSRTSGDSWVGQYSVQHDISVASAQGGTSWNIEPVTAGSTIRWAVYVKLPATGISGLELWWRNQTTTLATTSVLAQAVPGAWARVSGTYTVAAGQTVDRVSAVATSSASGGATWWADAALAVPNAPALPPYFDGANGGVWEGTPNASVSYRPAGTGRVYGSPGSSGRVVVVNAGSSAAYPVLRVDGPVASPSIEHVATGSAITIDATLQEGEFLHLDTRTRAVLLNGDTPRRHWVRGGSVWPLLPPGATELAYRGSPLTGAPDQPSLLTVTWRDTSL